MESSFSFLDGEDTKVPASTIQEQKDLPTIDVVETPKSDINKELSWHKALEEAKQHVDSGDKEIIEVQEREEKYINFFFTSDDERFGIGMFITGM